MEPENLTSRNYNATLQLYYVKGFKVYLTRINKKKNACLEYVFLLLPQTSFNLT